MKPPSFERSFASHPKAKCWSKTKNGEVTPRDVFKSSHKKCWSDCDKCHHAFESMLANIVKGQWCPKCKNKTELKLYEVVKRHYPTLIHQYNQEWCKYIKCLPFDFCIPEHNIIIELDGRQHFIQVSNWTSPEIENIINDNTIIHNIYMCENGEYDNFMIE